MGVRVQVQMDPVVSIYLTRTQQPTGPFGNQVEDVDLFNRMGLKRSATERTSSRAQRPSKRVRKQVTPKGRTGREGCRNQNDEARGSIIDKVSDIGVTGEENL